MRDIWLEEELRTLEAWYPTSKMSTLLKLLPKRSKDGIAHKACDLGLTKKNRGFQYIKVDLSTWNPQSAYLIGMLLADGYISSHSDKMALHFSLTDKELAEALSEMLGANIRIIRHIIKEDGYLRKDQFQINKTILASPLLKEYTGNKSRTMTFPDVPTEYLPYFLRGYFDGDGSVSLRKDAPGLLQVQFSIGSQGFAKSLTASLRRYGIHANCKTYKNKSRWAGKGKARNYYRVYLKHQDSWGFYFLIYGNRLTGFSYGLLRKKQVFERARPPRICKLCGTWLGRHDKKVCPKCRRAWENQKSLNWRKMHKPRLLPPAGTG